MERASLLFSEVYVAIGQNSDKPQRLLSVEETIALLKAELSHLKNVTVCSFKGLTVDYAKEIGAKALIRGLRHSLDFESERQMAQINTQLSGIETIFFPSHPDTKEISSTLIRQLVHNGAPLAKFLPKSIAEAITRRNK